MDWSHGVLEWILGVEPCSEMFERQRNIYSSGEIGLI